MSDFYGRVMPSSKKQLNDRVNDVKNDIEKQTHQLSAEISQLSSELSNALSKVDENIQKQESKFEVLYEHQKELNGKQTAVEKKVEAFSGKLETIQKTLHSMEVRSRAILRESREAVWAQIYHDATCESEWLKVKTFYPGRWAAGYPFLYALYRTLNEFQPECILELGLGQTTRMIGQYAASRENCSHVLVEHDQEWIDIFKQGFELSDKTEILRMDIEEKNYFDEGSCMSYVGFAETIGNRKFDLISIDAPFGGEGLVYSRMDILQMLPGCLNESFVIFVDDYNRTGEQNMVEKMKEILDEHGVQYETGIYKGNKETFILVSKNNRFLCTM